MAVINAVQLTREWFNNSQHGNNQDITDKDITVVGRIHVPQTFNWEETSGRNNPLKCQQKVTIANHKPAALAQISVASSDNFTRVVLKKGIVTGLRDKQTFCLPLAETGQVSRFGDLIELDPSQEIHEDVLRHERPNNQPLLKEKHIACGSTSAVIHYKKMQSEWKFTCQNATLLATAIINTERGVIEFPFTDIIRGLKRQDRGDLNNLQVENGKVRFTISGNVIFRWGSEHKVVW